MTVLGLIRTFFPINCEKFISENLLKITIQIRVLVETNQIDMTVQRDSDLALSNVQSIESILCVKYRNTHNSHLGTIVSLLPIIPSNHYCMTMVNI